MKCWGLARWRVYRTIYVAATDIGSQRNGNSDRWLIPIDKESSTMKVWDDCWMQNADNKGVAVRARGDAEKIIYMAPEGRFCQHINSKGCYLYTNNTHYILSTSELVRHHEPEKRDLRTRLYQSDVRKILKAGIEDGMVPGPGWMLAYILRCL